MSTYPPTRKALIGQPTNFWLYHSQKGFDLTHPSNPTTPVQTHTATLQTTTAPIAISPAKSALLIIDMQNFFLSESFGRHRGAGHAACEQLIEHAIPAARKAGMRIVWLNWGLTDEDVRDMPPAAKRAFGFFAIPEEMEFNEDFAVFEEHEGSVSVDKFGEVRSQGGHVSLENRAMYRGLGVGCGNVKLGGGEMVDAGRLLMRDTWNAALYPPLDGLFDEGTQLPTRPDVWMHKNRMSGLWGAKTECEAFLEKEGIRTLFFAGVNTDQCVGGTLTDALSKGYDCVLLSDGCGTTSPSFAQQCFEFNAARTFGFCTTCREFAEGIGK